MRAAVGGAATDKDEPKRAEARQLLKQLFTKLDALSHFHYAPKPVIEELAVRSDVAALVMEEVAPLAVSTAGMQRPEEMYRAAAAGDVRSEAELSRCGAAFSFPF